MSILDRFRRQPASLPAYQQQADTAYRELISDKAAFALAVEQLADQTAVLGYDRQLVESLREDLTLSLRTTGADGYLFGWDIASRRQRASSARLASRLNPYAKAMLAHALNFTLGGGLSFAARDPLVGELLTDFWQDDGNQQGLTSSTAQRARFRDLLLGGDLFLAFALKEDGRISVRPLPSDQIGDIVTSPDDANAPWFYVRRFYDRHWNYLKGDWQQDNQETTLYYADVTNWDRSTYANVPTGQFVPGIYVLHGSINNDMGKWGIPELFASDEWIRAHKSFMSDHSNLVAALKDYAWMRKYPTLRPPSGLGQGSTLIAGQGATRNTSGDGYPLRGAMPAGSTLHVAKDVDVQPIKIDTGASNAAQDGAMLLGAMGAGMGVAPHYLGYGADVNRATATTMALPTLRWMEAYQQIVQDYTLKALRFVLDVAEASGKLAPGYDDFIDVDTPGIVQKDTPQMMAALTAFAPLLPSNEESSRAIMRIGFSLLGQNNVDDLVTGILQAGQAAQADPAPAGDTLAEVRAKLEQVVAAQEAATSILLGEDWRG